MATKRDYYEVLGVSREVDADELKRSYRRLAMEYHPDRNGGDEEAARKFKEVAEAFEVLSDPEKRQLYDRYGHAGLEGGGLPSFSAGRSPFDLFSEVLGDIFGMGGGRHGPQGGRDLLLDIELDLTEAAFGVKKTVQFHRQEVCSDCSGSGARPGSKPTACRHCGGRGAVYRSLGGFMRVEQTCRGCGGSGQIITDPCLTCHGRARVEVERTLQVSIPAGVDTGMRIPCRGEGEAGERGAPRGDLYCRIHVREHPLFKRDGDHLICQVPITFSQAALGGEVQVPGLKGPFTHTFKRGVQSHEVVRIPGKGVPNVRGGRPGDLLVVVVVETPKNLTRRQEELLRELAEFDKKQVSPQRKSFFEKLKGLFTPSSSADAGGSKSEY
jgi:molecular chaperone DnaJ